MAPVVTSSGAMAADDEAPRPAHQHHDPEWVAEDGRRRPEADSYRAIAVRCWPAFRSLGCTGAGCEYHSSFGR